MQELEKILEEIDEICVDDTDFGVDCNLQGRSNLPCDNCYECIKDVTPELEKTILEMPAAFDKEKVIEELAELRQREYKDNEEEEESFDGEEIYDAGRSQGRFEAYHKAIEIVKKGGVEE